MHVLIFRASIRNSEQLKFRSFENLGPNLIIKCKENPVLYGLIMHAGLMEPSGR